MTHKLIAGVRDETGYRHLIFNASALCGQAPFIADCPRRNFSVAISMNHCERATRKISQATREIAVGAIDQVLVSKPAVLSEDHFAQTKVTNRINAKELIQYIQFDRIAECL